MTDFITPSATSMTWITNPEAASDAVAANLDLWQTAGFWGYVAGGIVILAGIAKYVHPLGAVIGPMVKQAAKAFMPTKMVQAEKQAKIMNATAWAMVQAVEALPADNPLVQELKKKISVAAPSEFHTIFDAWKKEQEQAPTSELDTV